MRRLGWFILLFCIFISTAWAVKMGSLYQAEIPVTSQSAAEREKAAAQGLLQVLIKVSGEPEIEKNPSVKNALKNADNYMQEYSYASQSDAANPYIIQIHFDIDEINSILKKGDVAYWGDNRPLLIVWLAVTTPEGTEIIGNEMPNFLLDDMKKQGKKYGLPLIFPMMDVQEVNQVSAEDITNMSLTILKEASERYSPAGLLIGHIKKSDSGFVGEWQLVLSDKQWNFVSNSPSMQGVITSVLKQINATLAKNYAVKNNQNTSVWLKLKISNVADRDDLSAMLQYLKQLSLVQQVQLLQVSGDIVELSVLVHGTATQFQQNVAIGQRLVSQELDEPKVQNDTTLMYEWTQ